MLAVSHSLIVKPIIFLETYIKHADYVMLSNASAIIRTEAEVAKPKHILYFIFKCVGVLGFRVKEGLSCVFSAKQ